MDELDGKADRTGAAALTSFYTLAPNGDGWTASLVGKTTVAPLRVSALELGTLSIDGEDLARLIVRGELDASGKLVVSEAYRAASSAAPSGTLWQMRSAGARCRADVPCFDLHAAKLNSTLTRDLSKIDGALADQARAAAVDGPVLVAGATHLTSDGGRTLALTQLWIALPADASTCRADSDCEATAFTRPVVTSADCYCPVCESVVVNRATAAANQASWDRECGNLRLRCDGAGACPATPHVACENARCAPASAE